MQSNALRELRALGVLDEVTEHGYAFSSLGLRAPDPAGTLLVELPDRSGGDLPGTVGIPRPVLARIVLDRAAQAGATVRLATSCVGLRQDTDGVDVTFADGSAGPRCWRSARRWAAWSARLRRRPAPAGSTGR